MIIKDIYFIGLNHDFNTLKYIYIVEYKGAKLVFLYLVTMHCDNALFHY